MPELPLELRLLIDKGMGRYITVTQGVTVPAGIGTGTVDASFTPSTDNTWWVVYKKTYGNTLTGTVSIREVSNLIIPTDTINYQSRVGFSEDTWLYISSTRPFFFTLINLTAVVQIVDITLYAVQVGQQGYNYLRTLLLGEEQYLLGAANNANFQVVLQQILDKLPGPSTAAPVPTSVEQDAE
jgi:hypothetical protein